MHKPEELVEKLTRANERLKVIQEIEWEAGQLEKIKAKWEQVTGKEKI